MSNLFVSSTLVLFEGKARDFHKLNKSFKYPHTKTYYLARPRPIFPKSNEGHVKYAKMLTYANYWIIGIRS